MSQTAIAIIILIISLIMYMIPQIPLSVTTIIAMTAMALSGIISFQDAFAGFGNNATLLVAGMMIIGQACFTSGLAESIGKLLFKFVGTNEKYFVVIILIVGSFLAVFLNGALVAAMMIPIVDCVVSQSNGTITRKHTYFPLGLASTLGNNLTTISATSMITASALVANAGYGEMDLFTPTLINLPALLIIILVYALVGYRLQQRWFDFPEIPLEAIVVDSNRAHSKLKITITAAVLIFVVIGLIAGLNSGACAIIGAALLILTRCIDEKTAFQSISWPTVVIVAGAMGISKGLQTSGAGEALANSIISICGPIGQSPFGLCIIFFILGSLLSNVMSDNASVAILVPIVIGLAQKLNCNPMPLILATASGIKVAVATPVSVTPMTMVQIAGYRFKDYLKMGGLINVIALVVTLFAIHIIYY